MSLGRLVLRRQLPSRRHENLSATTGRCSEAARRGRVTHLQRHDRVLHVQTSIDSERLGDDEERVGKCLHAELGPPFGVLLDLAAEERVRGNLERARAGDERGVLERVLDRPQTVSDRV